MSRAPGCRKRWSQLRTNAAQLQKREVISLGSESYQGYMRTGASIWLPEKHSGEQPLLGSKPGLEFTVNLLK